MATTTSSQAAQAGLVTALSYDLERAWNGLDISSLRQSLPEFTLTIAALVRRYGSASATLAVQQYLADRRAAGVRAAFSPKPAVLPPLPQVGATVSWATQPLWSATPDVGAAQQRLQGAADMLVMDVGRQTIVDNAQRDRHAKGWARIPEPGACSFCALLATRGAVYKQQTANFRSHDHCRCHAEPVFTAYEPSAQVREWQALYQRSTAGARGMHAKQLAWRKAFDNA